MVKMKKLKWFTIYANQYWKSLCITPSLSIDITWGSKNLGKDFRRVTLTLHWLPWWVSIEFQWKAQQK